MSTDLKVGDKVEILYYEEGEYDPPKSYIGKVGMVISIDVDDTEYPIRVNFDENEIFNTWDFSTEQLKLV